MEGIHAPAKVQASTDEEVREKIAIQSREKYDQEPKPLQVETVLNLLRGRNTFLLAATGFGKSRISEMYLRMLPKNPHGDTIGVVVVLNPLDALGDNQVEEKVAAGFTAINLTMPNFSEEVCLDIQEGLYDFVYLSPEMFLDNEAFSNVYFSPKFQSKLALIVVDEAHMIYSWGLVEGGQKKLKTIVRHQDFSAFRPHYGSLATQLLTKNQAPLLLMSATCRPAAITAIKKNLKLLDTHIDLLRDELTRPEIRILRIPMKSSIQSCEDILQVYDPKSHIPDEQLVPSLIYSGTRVRTLQVLEVLDQARGTPGNHLNPRNSFARRYHACTGELDKKDVIDDFASGKVPVLSCTLALGMGQNWKLVRQIIHIGRGDPSLICQMIGRCGRDGRPGLAILMVETNRPNGKNSIADFPPNQVQTDEDRMDALAITPVCLRIAFSMDNLIGYIPLDFNDPLYQAEKLREELNGFAPCMCSNCMEHAGKVLVQNLPNLNKDNFTDYTLNRVALNAVATTETKRKYTINQNGPTTKKQERVRLEPLKKILQETFNNFYLNMYGESGSLVPSDLFGDLEVEAIINYFGQIQSKHDLRQVIKGEMVKGQLEVLMKSIEGYRVRGAIETNALETGAPDKPSTSSQTNLNSNPDNFTPAKRPRKNAVSPETLRQREQAAAERNKAKELKLELQKKEQEAKARRSAWHLQNMNEIKKAHGLL
ncbi:uncharacterized protein PGTG_10866 [Puccinia graminis f. sp. tritici CRL 75-36-700-3]|uniref:DNA 3'-5' helicase n=1 Tax=Puccinia graminis f. sp. tritici (strain CRL 75-36-700-3 / race SCCL) TaxID=418459 RepID=E3KK82_PUCGT|nr:uncharacterized protein PGTG_10866 [Puccinia graminis f. sp. tritici CRL 75-36-700-3]EFP84707.2 hypothetical protein PGTG_10866 [Puccinia graminis f. sp. tritici CRL 75-36-700-3]